MNFEHTPLRRLRRCVVMAFCCAFALPFQTARAQAPVWVGQRPDVPGHYIGIGSAPRTGSIAEDRAAARAQALNDIASQISVTVTGEVLREAMERNDTLRSTMTSLVRASARAELEGVEIAGTYEDVDRCWAYLKLDRQAHRRRHEEKLRNAAGMAAGMIARAREAEAQGNVAGALRSYVQALVPMASWIHEPVAVEVGGKQVQPVQESYASIQRILDDIQLQPPQTSRNARFGKAVSPGFDVTARRAGGIPVRALPVQFSFLKGTGEMPREAVTDEQGMARAGIRKITSGDRLQIVEARVGLCSLLGQDTSSIVRVLLSSASVPRARLVLDITGPEVAVESEETLWDGPLVQKRIEPVIRQRLTERGFAFVEDRGRASILVTVKARARQGSRTMGLCFVFVTADVSAVDLESGREIYRRILPEIKEGSDSFEKAAMKAFGTAASKVADELVPQVVTAVQQ